MSHYAFRAISLLSLTLSSGCWCPRPADLFVRGVAVEVRHATSQPAALTYVTLHPVMNDPRDVRQYRARLDTDAMLGGSTAKTDAKGHATVPLILTERNDAAPKGLLRVRCDTYFGYSVIPLEAGGRANLGSMTVEIVSVGDRVPFDSMRRTADGVSLRWKGDQGYSK